MDEGENLINDHFVMETKFICSYGSKEYTILRRDHTDTPNVN